MRNSVPTRFTIQSTIDGWEVQDKDGRPVTNSFPNATRPLQIAGQLNDAAQYGNRSLAVALGAVDEDNADLDAVLTYEAVESLCV